MPVPENCKRIQSEASDDVHVRMITGRCAPPPPLHDEDLVWDASDRPAKRPLSCLQDGSKSQI